MPRSVTAAETGEALASDASIKNQRGTGNREPGTKNVCISLLRERLHAAPRFGLIAFAHFVDELDGLLQERDLRAQRVEQPVLRIRARRLRTEGITALLLAAAIAVVFV